MKIPDSAAIAAMTDEERDVLITVHARDVFRRELAKQIGKSFLNAIAFWAIMLPILLAASGAAYWLTIRLTA